MGLFVLKIVHVTDVSNYPHCEHMLLVDSEPVFWNGLIYEDFVNLICTKAEALLTRSVDSDSNMAFESSELTALDIVFAKPFAGHVSVFDLSENDLEMHVEALGRSGGKAWNHDAWLEVKIRLNGCQLGDSED